MLKRGSTYHKLCDDFAWSLPDRLNLAEQIVWNWAKRAPERPAILDVTSGEVQPVSYVDLASITAALAGHLKANGIQKGDRVGVLRSQDRWCAAAHAAIWQIGAISVPLFKLFREDALANRIHDAGCQMVITDEEGASLLGALAAPIIPERGLIGDPTADIAETGPETPAILIYTSGTTGKPKGALHGHRILTGHLPGVEMSHDFLGQQDDILWTPADWAWIGGLFDVLMPGLALGVPVVAARMPRFDVAACVDFIRQTGIRNVFFPPTALRMLKAEGAQIEGLRTVASGGEPLGAEMLAWGREALGVTINEFYGQTECNMVASSCQTLFQPRPGAIGRPVPGFDVQVIDANRQPTADEGDIAVRKGPASMMLRYWNNPEATAEKFRSDWMLTGDRGRMEDGFVTFKGREDDVITSGGYRIGPAEIEDCLLTHPEVATVGVVGKPDPLRTEIVKAYVVRKPGANVTEEDLQAFVKSRLAAYSYPREITFLDSLPMTVTGKVIRKELKARAAKE
ncbi:MAG: AMP-binding protein [Pseudomonadota bacterium]